MHLELLFLFHYCAIGRVHSLILLIGPVVQTVLAEVSCKSRLRREDVVLVALFAVLRVLGGNSDLLLYIIDVSQFGVGILPEHQGSLHES